jgi:hypothetical protein
MYRMTNISACGIPKYVEQVKESLLSVTECIRGWLLMLGRLKYIQLNNQHLNLLPFTSRQLSLKPKSPGNGTTDSGRGTRVCSEIHKLSHHTEKRKNCLNGNRGTLFHPKKNDETGCDDNGGLSMLPAPYKILSNILVSSTTPNENKISGNHSVEYYITDQLLLI